MSRQQTMFGRFDAAARTGDLSKGASAPESQDAYRRIEPQLAESQAELLNWLRDRLEIGGTSKEFAFAVGRPLNAVSGRFSELQAMTLIYKTGRRRGDAAVWVASR